MAVPSPPAHHLDSASSWLLHQLTSLAPRAHLALPAPLASSALSLLAPLAASLAAAQNLPPPDLSAAVSAAAAAGPPKDPAKRAVDKTVRGLLVKSERRAAALAKEAEAARREVERMKGVVAGAEEKAREAGRVAEAAGREARTAVKEGARLRKALEEEGRRLEAEKARVEEARAEAGREKEAREKAGRDAGEARKEAEAAKKERAKVEKELRGAREKIEALGLESTALAKQVDQSGQKAVKELERKMQQQENATRKANLELDAVRNSIDGIKAEKAAAEAKLDQTLKDVHQEHDAAVRELKREVADKVEKIKDLEIRIGLMNKRVEPPPPPPPRDPRDDRMDRYMDMELKTMQERSMHERIMMLERQLDYSREREDRLMKTANAASKHRHDPDEDLQRDWKKKDAALLDLENEMRRAEQVLEMCNNSLLRALSSAGVNTAGMPMAKALEMCEGMLAELPLAAKACAELEQRLEETTAALNDTSAALNDAEAALAERDAILADRENDLADREAALDSISMDRQNEGGEAVEVIAMLEGERDHLLQELENLNGELETLSGILGERDEEIAELTGQADAMMGDIEQLEDILRQRDEEIEGLARDREEVVGELTGELDNMHGELMVLSDILVERDEVIEQLEMQNDPNLVPLLKDTEDMTGYLEELLQERDAQILDLDSALNGLTEERNIYYTESIQTQEALNAVVMERDTLLNELRYAADHITELESLTNERIKNLRMERPKPESFSNPDMQLKETLQYDKFYIDALDILDHTLNQVSTPALPTEITNMNRSGSAVDRPRPPPIDAKLTNGITEDEGSTVEISPYSGKSALNSPRFGAAAPAIPGDAAAPTRMASPPTPADPARPNQAAPPMSPVALPATAGAAPVASPPGRDASPGERAVSVTAASVRNASPKPHEVASPLPRPAAASRLLAEEVDRFESPLPVSEDRDMD